MSEFSLPAPWGASESQLDCARCGKVTNHYERRVTVMADEASDRRAGHVAWFCTECGTKHEPRSEPDPPSQSGDDLTELFDRH
jgi:rubrerythrin